MNQLYPPIIEGKLPACGSNILVVPFVMNRAVSVSQVTSMSAIIKTTTTGRTIDTFEGVMRQNPAENSFEAVFDVGNTLLSGQYYKIQIAYKNESGVGYYSSVGVFKRTSFPELTIPELEESIYSDFEYTAIYSQEKGDVTEKVYSYKFDLTDIEDNLIETSGIQIHDGSKDTEIDCSQDTWRPKSALQKNTPYYLTYQVKTNNGLEVKTRRYLLMGQESVDMGINMDLYSKLDPDNGSVKIFLTTDSKEPIYLNGNFILSRSKNFSYWEDLYRLSYWNIKLEQGKDIEIWEDLTAEHGEEYIYAIQAYNSNGLYSNRKYAKNGITEIYFDDAFLYDGEYQLKIQYNPKVSSFKTIILESKQETIGSKYPFILRNGDVSYKEFQISGLLSLLSDPDEKFMKREEWALMRSLRTETPSEQSQVRRLTTDLTDENFFNERQFKLKVLDWLNNGKPKLFRSPSEGNYIVRLMNNSLSPNDTLGRMLHTFSCTADEIAEPEYSNLIDLDLIHYKRDKSLDLRIGEFMPVNAKNLTAKEKEILDYDFNSSTVIFNYDAYMVRVSEARPGTIVQFQFVDNRIVDIEIGGTGAYYLQLQDKPVRAIKLISDNWYDAKIGFGYYNESFFNAFNNIANLTIGDEIRRYIGPGYQFNLPQSSWNDNNLYVNGQLYHHDKVLSDIRREIGSFSYIKVEKRYIQDFYIKDGKNYYCGSTEKTQGEILETDFNPLVIYYDVDNKKYYNGKIGEGYGFDPDFRFCINNSEINFSDLTGIKVPDGLANFDETAGRLEFVNWGEVDELRIGTGLVADLAYRVRIKEYDVEVFDDDVIEKKKAWLNKYEIVKDYIIGSNGKENHSVEYINQLILELNTYYVEYINAIEKGLKERRAEAK